MMELSILTSIMAQEQVQPRCGHDWLDVGETGLPQRPEFF